MLKFRPKAGDYVVAFIIIAIAVMNFAVFTFQAQGNQTTAVIIKNGTVVRSINLSSVTKLEIFRFEGKYSNVIAAENGKICFSEANCPDKVCVHTGWISKPGQSAACLPARIIVKVASGNVSPQRSNNNLTNDNNQGASGNSGEKNSDLVITEDKNNDVDIKLK